MVEEVNPAVIKKTQEILGSVIKKPPLAEKNLKRPPFRFLHDIFTNVIKTTGFMKGLYTPEEMLSENIKDKESKIAFLQKAIDLLALVTNQPINVKPSKIVAGHEAQKTNEFLQILGMSVKSKIDTKEAVQAVLEKSSASNQKERKPVAEKKSSQKNASEKAHARSTTKTIEPAKKPSQGASNKESSKTKDPEKSRSRSKESKSRDKEKPKDKSKTKRDESKSRTGKSESKRDRSSKHAKESAEATAYESPVKKPTIQQNGSVDVDSVHDDTEMHSVELPADSNDGDSKMLNGELAEINSESPVKLEREQNQAVIARDEEKKPDESPQKPMSSGHISRPPSARNKRTKLGAENESRHEGGSTSAKSEAHQPAETKGREEVVSPFARPISARPSSSRPAPPRIRIRHIVENEEPSVRPETAKPVENVILDKKESLEGEEEEEEEEEKEDEAFVVSEEKGENLLEEPLVTPALQLETPDEDKGSLVKQLLATKRDLEGGSQHPSVKVEIDKSQMALNRMRESANRELEQLRNYIQNVSKTAYPLGRMLDYLQEDVDSMKAELKMWREEHQQNLVALRKEKSITESVLEPLRIQLDDLDQLVQDQLDANAALKSTILRNEEKIQRMLTGIQRKS